MNGVQRSERVHFFLNAELNAPRFFGLNAELNGVQKFHRKRSTQSTNVSCIFEKKKLFSHAQIQQIFEDENVS